ncbi:MAG: 8-amino-7-oxononanoate synthase [Deltaproteobacteria bacterium HGW-Deltaproteobacteria-4]|nr:MAG: 8-amino-7-oxononanoate synthase [Deltaproteobacteria bacterium HGW-Deltaproteobacteria-4]
MNNLLADYQKELASLDAKGMRRVLRTIESAPAAHVRMNGRDTLLLSSNNYLGLATHPQLIAAASSATARFGVGSSGSRLLSGSLSPHRDFEEEIAAFKGTEAALLFNCGYAANTGILQGLFDTGDIIFSDALNHASIIDGCRLSSARTIVYPHADVAALEELLVSEMPCRRGKWVIVTDGVFSMDGVIAPLAELVRLKDKYDALLMVDDAHGTGVLGTNGRGSAELCGCLSAIDLHMGTLGKALGGAGAYLAAARPLVDTLINRSRSFIFSTSLPPAVPAAASAALRIVASPEGAQLRARLAENRQCFTTRLQAAGLDLLDSTTQIVPILTKDPQPTMAAASALLAAGICLQGVRPPTVPVGRCRLRATVMATHDPLELEAAAAQIIAIIKGQGGEE